MTASLLNNLPVIGMSPDGRGVAILASAPSKSGKIVFVQGALPGQTVQCKLISEKKSFAEGVAEQIVSFGSATLTPVCPHQLECGGCPLQTMPYKEQLYWKEKVARDSLERIGKIPGNILDTVCQPVHPSPEQIGFRNKIELAFGRDEAGQIIAGYRKPRSHEVFPLKFCALIEPAGNALIQDLVKVIQGAKIEANFWQYLILRKGLLPVQGTQAWWLIIRSRRGSATERAVLLDMAKSFFASHPNVACFIHEETINSGSHSQPGKRIFTLDKSGTHNPRAATLRHDLCGRSFLLDASSFFQVNDGSAQILARLVRESITGSHDTLLDLYCGVGAPGQLVDSLAKRGIGIEANVESVKFAKRNSLHNNFSYYSANVQSGLQKLNAATLQDCVCLTDPPRSGMEKGALQVLMGLGPQQIVYVSCNPVTFARDSAILIEKYKLSSIRSVDMFPHTPHIELCASWEKK